MKRIIILIITLLAAVNVTFSQCAPVNPCSKDKVISPAISPPAGVAIVASTCSTLVVQWTGMANLQYNARATFKNAATNNVDTIEAVSINVNANNICKANFNVVSGEKYTIHVQSSGPVGPCTLYSYVVTKALDYPIAACNGNGLQFSGRVFLQGAYNTGTAMMSNQLNTSGVLQSDAAQQPYNNARFNYTGTEQVSNGFFAAHNNIVDWVLIELRDPNAPNVVKARRAAFVTQQGTLIDIDGTTEQISFSGVPAGYYNVAIRHRNHLGIRSVQPVDFSSGNGVYDFTSANYTSYKNLDYTSTVQVGNVWCMRAGNAFANGVVRYTGPGNVQNQILNVALNGSLSKIITNVYAAEDINMDGSIRWTGPGNDQNALLNGVLAGSLSAILNEQF